MVYREINTEVCYATVDTFYAGDKIWLRMSSKVKVSLNKKGKVSLNKRGLEVGGS